MIIELCTPCTADELTFLDIIGRLGMLELAAFGSAMLADNDDNV